MICIYNFTESIQLIIVNQCIYSFIKPKELFLCNHAYF